MTNKCGVASCYKTKAGVFYLRYYYPVHLRAKLPELPQDFRMSLKTKTLREARRRSMALEYHLDRVIQAWSHLGSRELAEKFAQERIRIKQHPVLSIGYHEAIKGNHIRNMLMTVGVEPFGLPAIHSGSAFSEQPVALKVEQSVLSSQNRSNQISFREVAEAYLFEKESSGEWTDRTLKNRKAKLRNIVELVGAETIFERMTTKDVFKVRDFIYRFPKNRTKMPNVRDKTLSQVFQMSLDAYEVLDHQTANNMLGVFKDICAYGIPRFHTDDIIASLKPRQKAKARRGRKRSFATLNKEKLQALLSAHHYTSVDKRIRVNYTPDKFWVPLIGMFSGARVGEILQLRVCDVVESVAHGCWYFDLNDEHEGKRLKTDNSRRWVPIHSSLLKLGFLEFMTSRGEGDDKLFKEVTYSGQDDDTNSFGKWFERTLRKEIGWSAARKETFHSLRHTFVDNLRRTAGLHDWEIASVVGHLPSDEGLTTLGYGSHRIELSDKKAYIEQLNYGVDLAALSWERYRRCFLD
ncbi:site-specific integrase [Oceanisphaera sediminis]